MRPALYEDVFAGPANRPDPAYVLTKADDPRDPVFPGAVTILLKAQAGGLPIYDTILASSNLSPRDVERAAATGELTNFGKHPGSTFLGAIGEALVMRDFTLHSALGLPGSLHMWPQPGAAILPAALSKQNPDLLIAQLGGCPPSFGGVLRMRQQVDFTETIGAGTGGLVGTVHLGPNIVISVVEVTTSTQYKFLEPRAQRVAKWAKALGGFTPPGTSCAPVPVTVWVALLAIDRGAYFSLSPVDQMNLVNIVTSAGGFIMLFRNLAGNSIQQAMALHLQIAPVSRP